MEHITHHEYAWDTVKTCWWAAPGPRSGSSRFPGAAVEPVPRPGDWLHATHLGHAVDRSLSGSGLARAWLPEDVLRRSETSAVPRLRQDYGTAVSCPP